MGNGFHLWTFHMETEALARARAAKLGTHHRPYLHKGGHQPSGEVKVGNVGEQTGVIVVDVGRALSPHVGGLSVEAMGRRAKVRVLGPPPGWVLIDPRMWHAVARVVVRGSHLCKTKTCFRLAGKLRAGQYQGLRHSLLGDK